MSFFAQHRDSFQTRISVNKDLYIQVLREPL
jgi:hypothetical protein